MSWVFVLPNTRTRTLTSIDVARHADVARRQHARREIDGERADQRRGRATARGDADRPRQAVVEQRVVG